MVRQNASSFDYAHVLLRYDRVRVLLHITQSIHAHGLRFAVHGTRASYIKCGLDPQENQSKAGMKPTDRDWGIDTQAGALIMCYGAEQISEKLIHSERGAYPAFYAELFEAITNNEPNPVEPQDAINVMTVLDAAVQSTRSCEEVVI